MSAPHNEATRGVHWLAIPLVSVLWGLNWATLGLAVHEIPPWTLRAIIFVAAGLVMLTMNVARGHSLRVPRSEWAVVFIFALLFMVVVSILQSYAQLLASSGRMAVITYTMP